MGGNASNGQPLLINELAAVLNEFGGAVREEIASKYPELASELDGGVWAGPEEDKSDNSLLIMKAKFTSEVLEETTQKGERAINAISVKLQKSNQVRLLGQLAAVIGSSSAIGAVGFGEQLVAQISAGFALIGSISGILSGHIETIISKKPGSINEVYERLSNYLSEATILKNNINAHLSIGTNEKELAKLISSGNELARKMNADTLQIPQYWLQAA